MSSIRIDYPTLVSRFGDPQLIHASNPIFSFLRWTVNYEDIYTFTIDCDHYVLSRKERDGEKLIKVSYDLRSYITAQNSKNCKEQMHKVMQELFKNKTAEEILQCLL